MFSISEKSNKNYLAKIVQVKNLRKHSNADRLAIFTVDGNNVITGLSTQEGDIGIYFPLECAISSEFLSKTNEFKDNNLNSDVTKKGFFEYHGRVKALRLRGEKSEGYYVPIKALQEAFPEYTDGQIANAIDQVGTEFNYIGSHELVTKYIPRGARTPGEPGSKKDRTKAKPTTLLIEGQFRFHEDTPQLGKNMHKISPDDIITITNKLHGTSFVSSNILCKRKLSVVERIAKWFGAKVQEEEYKNIYSSRKVVKNDPAKFQNRHYYSYDLWGDINEEVKDLLPKGVTIYGECVGFTKDGGYIQKGYDYGCSQSPYNDVDHNNKIFIYRATYTNVDGKVFEYTWQQVKNFCEKYGLNHVPELYHGKAKNLFPISEEFHFQENFFERLKENYLEKDCDMCTNKVPAEGITVRVDNGEWDIYKLKSFRFLEKESKDLDKGEVDIETQQSTEDGSGNNE